MNPCRWIICERGGRWTPAFRQALEHAPADEIRHRVREVRYLAELSDELVRSPDSITAVEVHRGNFADVLAWLAEAGRRYPNVGCVAICDRALDDSQITAALCEAGAVEVTHSPRRLEAICDFGRRHAETLAASRVTSDELRPLSFTARAPTALPWQDA